MAVNKRKGVFVVIYLYMALLLCMLPSQAEAKLSRIRRQACQDGTYEHEGRNCCKCPAGYRVEMHCTDQDRMPKCEACATGQYQSHANQQTTCDRCTSCAHPNANLEVDRHCTPIADSTCKCKKDHYCPSGKTPCKVCEPCQVCGPEGEKLACSAANNTICNDKPQDKARLALGITIPLVIVAGAVAAAAVYYFKKKRRPASKNIENGHKESTEVTVPLHTIAAPVPAVRLRPFIPAIAEQIGWKTMRNLAMSSKIPTGVIESCEEDKKDSVERTIALLGIWEEKEGKNASTKLIQYLTQNNQNSKAEEVVKILRGGSS